MAQTKQRKRVEPTNQQRNRLFEANAYRCCVCKRGNVGLQLHHIDGNRGNTVDTNLAVLCVMDHDQHHRPATYTGRLNHTELTAAEILNSKRSWERFVEEARKPEPMVLATLSLYGTTEFIHSLQLVLHWPDKTIAFIESYHLLSRSADQLIEQICQDIVSIGPKIKLAVVNERFRSDYCSCCGNGLSRVMKTPVTIRLTDPDWASKSSAGIYVNPLEASLAIAFSLRDEVILKSSLHLCQGRFLHYHDDCVDERIPVDLRLNVRKQAIEIVESVLANGRPKSCLSVPGIQTAQNSLRNLFFPDCWDSES